MRKTAMLWLVLAVICGGMLFQTSQRVTDGRTQLAGIEAAARKEDEHLRVLQAEWSYLNQPDRLEKLSNQYLHLEPLKGKQFAKVADLEQRPADVVAAVDPAAPVTEPETAAAPVVTAEEPAAAAAPAAKPAPVAATAPLLKPVPQKPATAAVKPQPVVKAKPQPSLVWKAPPPPAARKPGVAWSAPQPPHKNPPPSAPPAQQQQPRQFGDLMKSLGVQ
ncbi:MAG: hypothetical protein IT560_09195 [Alphaproteobacteria bacterium]|nr:hypothetical protein [Alphaproteobacteria bacterium]